LRNLTYVSTSVGPMAPQVLLDLLAACRKNNERLNVTGLLLHRSDAFFQILEGPEASVREIFDLICTDPRHRNPEVLLDEPIRKRQFPDWRMGFLNLDELDLTLLPGYSDFLTRDISPRMLFREMTKSQRMALMFRELD
jgi:hypothetical protein